MSAHNLNFGFAVWFGVTEKLNYDFKFSYPLAFLDFGLKGFITSSLHSKKGPSIRSMQ